MDYHFTVQAKTRHGLKNEADAEAQAFYGMKQYRFSRFSVEKDYEDTLSERIHVGYIADVVATQVGTR